MILYFFIILCILLGVALILCLIRIHSIHRGTDELRTEFAARLRTDTNVASIFPLPTKKCGF